MIKTEGEWRWANEQDERKDLIRKASKRCNERYGEAFRRMANTFNVKIKRLHADAVIPQYAHETDAGFDLIAVDDIIVEPGETVIVPTGLAFEIPAGYELQIRPRSGITAKTNLRVQLGTVDAGYRGEVSVIVDNIAQYLYEISEHGHIVNKCLNVAHTITGRIIDVSYDLFAEETYIIRKGDRIAQGVIAPVAHATFTEVDELGESERGEGGFGSSGVRYGDNVRQALTERFSKEEE